MKKKNFEALERIFAKEIFGFPHQSKAKIYDKLLEEGMVQQTTLTKHFKDGFPPMRLSGWSLTLKGHMEFCEACTYVVEGGSQEAENRMEK